jgi:AcrR family transcriptional regulator
MARTKLTPEARRTQILDVALRLFETRGFAETSVDEIVRAAGVAKGTFYYYYQTKQDVLGALASRIVAELAKEYCEVADDPSLTPLEKLAAIFAMQPQPQSAGVIGNIHRPENRELHDRNNVEIVKVLGPIVASVVEQGCAQGAFEVEEPLATAQFVLAGSLFLFGDGVFDWSPQEWLTRQRGMIRLIERALAVEDDALAALLAETPPVKS